MYISNLIYKCYKWNKYWWMLYLFHLNKWKRNYLLYANKIYGLEPDIWKIGHEIFYENYFLLLNFRINCPVLYDFIHVYSFFSSCYCILGDFFSIVYTYIIFFFHCLVIVLIVYTVCLKEMTLIVLPSGTFSPVYIMLYVIVINTYVICTWLKRSL